MNKKYFLGLAIATLMGISFTACVKDPAITEPTSNARWIIIGLLKRFNTCQDAFSICIRVDNLRDEVARTFPLEVDEALCKPMASADGSVVMDMEVDMDDLSDKARFQLLQEKALIVEEDFVLSKEVMQQAYNNAGLPYSGQQLEVLKGLYRVEVLGNSDGTPPQRIKITITFKDGKITITITW